MEDRIYQLPTVGNSNSHFEAGEALLILPD
jgi:hypothetical protein